MTGTPSIEEEKATPEQVDYITAFRALSNKTSVDIIAVLVADDAYVGDIVAALVDVPQATVSKLLKQLKGAGLVTSTKEGVKRKYAIRWESFAELSELLDGIAHVVGIRNGGFWNPELIQLQELNTTGEVFMYQSYTPEDAVKIMAAFGARESYPASEDGCVTLVGIDTEPVLGVATGSKQFAMTVPEDEAQYLTHGAYTMINGVEIGGVRVDSDGTVMYEDDGSLTYLPESPLTPLKLNKDVFDGYFSTYDESAEWIPSTEVPVTKKRSFWDWLRS